MGKHQPLLIWILLFNINIPLLKNKLERERDITGLLDVTLMRGYLMKRCFSVDPFAYTMALLLGLTG